MVSERKIVIGNFMSQNHVNLWWWFWILPVICMIQIPFTLLQSYGQLNFYCFKIRKDLPLSTKFCGRPVMLGEIVKGPKLLEMHQVEVLSNPLQVTNNHENNSMSVIVNDNQETTSFITNL